jgi:hypothetical protein
MSTPTLVVIYITASVALAYWNKAKGNGFLLGFLYCLFLTPLIGAVAIAVAEEVVIMKTGTGVKRSCPRCFALTPANISFCEECGAHIVRQTVKQYLQLAELAVGLIATVVIIRMLM